MKLSSRIAEVVRKARRSHAHVAERVKVMFALSLDERRRAAGLSYSDLAGRMDTSPAYITKVFRGDSNLTIETMAKLAVATGSELDIRLTEAATAELARWTPEVVAAAKAMVDQLAAGGTATTLEVAAMNDERFALAS
jgi:transcriptional regulator with XRE-family HTH domain